MANYGGDDASSLEGGFGGGGQEGGQRVTRQGRVERRDGTRKRRTPFQTPSSTTNGRLHRAILSSRRTASLSSFASFSELTTRTRPVLHGVEVEEILVLSEKD